MDTASAARFDCNVELLSPTMDMIVALSDSFRPGVCLTNDGLLVTAADRRLALPLDAAVVGE